MSDLKRPVSGQCLTPFAPCKPGKPPSANLARPTSSRPTSRRSARCPRCSRSSRRRPRRQPIPGQRRRRADRALAKRFDVPLAMSRSAAVPSASSASCLRRSAIPARRCSTPGGRSRPTRRSPTWPGLPRCGPLATRRTTSAAMAAAITRRTRLSWSATPTIRPGRWSAGRSWAVRRSGPPETAWWCWTRRTASTSATQAPDGIDLYRDRPNVAVLRTFSKAYGLAGLRVGFLIGHEPVAEAVRKTMLPSR